MKYFIYFLVSLCICKAMGQSPGDFVPLCRQNDMDSHIFPTELELMLDSYDYLNLFDGIDAVWVTEDVDGDSFQWRQAIGGSCAWVLDTCTPDMTISPQENWIFSQYISYRESNEIFFNMSYSLTSCRERGSMRCTNEYLTLYRYDTNGIVSDALRTNPVNYVPLFGNVANSRLGTTPTVTRDDVNLNLVRPEPRTNGFYLGFLDDGTCGSITRVIVHYLVVRARSEALLTCPEVEYPPIGGQATFQRDCSCGLNASPTTSLGRICNGNGVCNENQVCGCSPGFELSGTNCIACLENTYRAGISNSSCLPCPTNSESRGSNNTICQCVPPNIRNVNRPDDPCSQPPSSPRLLLEQGGAPRVSQDSVRVCWLSALDGGGLNDLHYNVYLYNTDQDNPVFNKVNSDGIFRSMEERLCFDVTDVDPETSYGIIVVSANGATGDPEMLTDISEVQDRFVVFFVTLGSSQPSVAVSVVVTFFVTALVTAVATAGIVILIMMLVCKKPHSNSQKDPVEECMMMMTQNQGYGVSVEDKTVMTQNLTYITSQDSITTATEQSVAEDTIQVSVDDDDDEDDVYEAVPV